MPGPSSDPEFLGVWLGFHAFRELPGDSNIQCGLGTLTYSPDLEFREPQSVRVHGGGMVADRQLPTLCLPNTV